MNLIYGLYKMDTASLAKANGNALLQRRASQAHAFLSLDGTTPTQPNSDSRSGLLPSIRNTTSITK
jgi:hypothetical protein